MIKLFKSAALAAATASVLVAAVPATAANLPASSHSSAVAAADSDWNNGRRDNWNGHYDARYSDRSYNNGRYDNRRYDNDRGNYNNNRSWRGRDGRNYCRRDDGTTGLLIGGAVGGLLGHEIAGRGDNTLGTILGVAGGALLGREVDRGGSRCR